MADEEDLAKWFIALAMDASDIILELLGGVWF
jgi:hypothetical protein